MCLTGLSDVQLLKMFLSGRLRSCLCRATKILSFLNFVLPSKKFLIVIMIGRYFAEPPYLQPPHAADRKTATLFAPGARALPTLSRRPMKGRYGLSSSGHKTSHGEVLALGPAQAPWAPVLWPRPIRAKHRESLLLAQYFPRRPLAGREKYGTGTHSTPIGIAAQLLQPSEVVLARLTNVP